VARPHKQTVDYFPHDTDASEGKTLTIIQAKYGNDGYALWFKLLQLLGKSSGHYFDFNNPADWEFLLAKTHQKSTESLKAILETLVLLGAIDAELYKNGIIWCQKFVNGISDAYERTINGAPKRPDLPVNVENEGVSVSNNSEKTTKTPQTKLKETKLNNIKPEWIDKNTWLDWLEMRKKKRIPNTERALYLAIKTLERLRKEGNDPKEVLEQSIMRGYSGLFPVKGDFSGKEIPKGFTKLG